MLRESLVNNHKPESVIEAKPPQLIRNKNYMELFPGTVNRVWVSCPPKNSRVTTFYTVLKPKFEILKERDTQIPLRSSMLDFN